MLAVSEAIINNSLIVIWRL